MTLILLLLCVLFFVTLQLGGTSKVRVRQYVANGTVCIDKVGTANHLEL